MKRSIDEIRELSDEKLVREVFSLEELSDMVMRQAATLPDKIWIDDNSVKTLSDAIGSEILPGWHDQHSRNT